MNLCLIGGGEKQEILRSAIQYTDGSNILLVPSACSTELSYNKKVINTALDFRNLGMATKVLHRFGRDPGSEQAEDLFDWANMVYVIGGHTPTLKSSIDRTGLGSRIRTFMERGGLYAGTSAGALAVFSEAMICPAKKPREETWEYERVEMIGALSAFATVHANGLDGKNTQPRINYFRNMLPYSRLDTAVAIDESTSLLVVEECARTLPNRESSAGSVTIFQSREGVVNEVIDLDRTSWIPVRELGLELKAN